MILEAVVVGAVVGTVLAFVRARTEKSDSEAEGVSTGESEIPPEEPAASTMDASEEPLGLTNDGLGVGDVLLYADTEFWLAGGIELKHGRSGLRVFHCPGSTRGEWLIQQGRGVSALVLAQRFEGFPEGRVPSEYPVKGLSLKLKERGSATVRSDGDFPGGVPEQADYTVLRGSGGKVLLVLDVAESDGYRGPGRIVLLGDPLEEGLFELLGG